MWRLPMCRVHWTLVPRDLQDELRAAAAAIRNGGTHRYLIAVNRAALAVAEKDENMLSSSDSYRREIARLEKESSHA